MLCELSLWTNTRSLIVICKSFPTTARTAVLSRLWTNWTRWMRSTHPEAFASQGSRGGRLHVAHAKVNRSCHPTDNGQHPAMCSGNATPSSGTPHSDEGVYD